MAVGCIGGNMASKTWFNIENKKSDEATIYIYDEISSWGITAKQFVKDLNEVTAKTINLKINSPGGNVFDGITIFNALKDHNAKVHVKIDGLAASIASVIAMAGDTVDIAKNAMMMVHKAWTIAIGNANDMEDTAKVLNKIDDTLVTTYAGKTGLATNKINELMSDETWLNADEAKELGFVDTIGGESDAKASFDLSKYNKVPQAALDRFAAQHDKAQASERELEQILRDAGCSKKAALAAVAAVKGETRRDSEDDAQKLKDYMQCEQAKGLIKSLM